MSEDLRLRLEFVKRRLELCQEDRATLRSTIDDLLAQTLWWRRAAFVFGCSTIALAIKVAIS